jgi:hypothetical protein
MHNSISTTSPVLNGTSIVLTLPTGETTAPTPASSTKSDASDRVAVFASAGGFILLLAVIGHLFCLKYTRTKHRRLIENMERRLRGLEIQRAAQQTRRVERFSITSGTTLGSSWGSWRSKDVQSFQKLRTANKTTKVEDRKSFGQGWWSFSPQPTIEKRHHVPLQTETIKSPPAALRLSAIVESQSPARADSPTMTTSHHDSTIIQSRVSELQENKEINVIPEKGGSPSLQYTTSPIVAVDKEYIPEARRTSPLPAIPNRSHQRRPAIVRTISPFPSSTSEETDFGQHQIGTVRSVS